MPGHRADDSPDPGVRRVSKVMWGGAGMFSFARFVHRMSAMQRFGLAAAFSRLAGEGGPQGRMRAGAA
ncbi:hypothetical protein LG3211_3417 [Lysobacter gummosus]|nr:hypothetical protein LG3211_3417 [Lysobacter gummosus]